MTSRQIEQLLQQLDALERAGGGALRVGRGTTLNLAHLQKVFFPKEGYTKGDLMKYYVKIAPFILPVIADRPLVLKRFPDGIDKESFYQHKPGSGVPKGVRVETIRFDGSSDRRFVGGDLATLLYTIQLGSISVDPWHSRVTSVGDADYAILDLDPSERATFKHVVQVARWIKEELDTLGLRGIAKTSGATGIHIYLPLPRATSNETALLFAQRLSSRVAERHPSAATTTRAVGARKSTSVYVDYLQNIRSKTVAGAYCVRAKPGATVSTPLEWDELTDTLDPHAFTIVTAPERFARLGDIWRATMRRPNTLRALQDVIRA